MLNMFMLKCDQTVIFFTQNCTHLILTIKL